MSELCSVPRVSERFAQSNALDEDIARLKYVSGKREEALRRLGIRTVGDLLLHIPHRYLDFTRSWSIEMAPIGTVCTIIATVDRIVQKQPRPRMQVTEVSLVDETGVLQVAFFRQPWIAQQLKQGDRLAVMGKVEFAYGFKQMASPHFEKLEDGRAAGTILPVHYVSDGVSQAWMRRIVSGALEVVGNPFDPIPAPLRAKRKLMSNARALRSIHFPSSMAERDIARRRLAYEECLYLQLALRLRNDGGLVDVVPYAHTAGEHLGALKQALPFSLSDEQEAAFQDILHDMCDGGRVMNRLLLGDVGTGKTAVAACALAVAADSGTQACVMAPTACWRANMPIRPALCSRRPACPGQLLTAPRRPQSASASMPSWNRASLTCSLAPMRCFRITLRSSICRLLSSTSSTALALASATPYARRAPVPICSL